MRTQVMSFGVRRISQGAEFATEQMGSAHHYYNRLMEIALQSRAEYRAIRLRAVPELDSVERELEETTEQIESLLEDIRLTRQRDSVDISGAVTPTKTPATLEQREELDRLRNIRKALSARAKELRGEFKALTSAEDAEFARRTAGTSGPHAKRHANDEAFSAMLDEPQWSTVWKQLKISQYASRDARATARAECGLAPGTYAAVEDAVDAACKTAQGDPRFRRFDGGRKIGIQLAGRKLTGADFYAGTDSRLGVVSRQPTQGRKDPLQRVKRSATSKRNFVEYAVVRMSAGKGESRQEIRVDAKLHRPVPLDAQITWAYLVPRRIGFRTVYSLQLTVNTAEPLVDRQVGTGECDVELRWSRASDGSLVVATINGEPFALDGAEYREYASSFGARGGAYSGMLRARELRGHADQHFDTAKSALIQYLETHAHSASEWLVEATSSKPGDDGKRGRAGIGRWKRHGALAYVAKQWVSALGDTVDVSGLWRDWVRERTSSGKDLFCYREELSTWLESSGVSDEHHMGLWLEWWRRKGEHLLQWSADSDAKARRNRRDQYRNKAARLAETFERCTVHGFDLAGSAKRKPADKDDDELHKQARYQRTCASPSEFVDCLRHAFGKERFALLKRERSGDAENHGGSRDSTDHAGSVA